MLVHDTLFQRTVVQRSRAYVRRARCSRAAGQRMFPEREASQVAEYSVKKTYGSCSTWSRRPSTRKSRCSPWDLLPLGLLQGRRTRRSIPS